MRAPNPRLSDSPEVTEPAGEVFDRMKASGHAMFLLAAAEAGIVVESDRDRLLVDTAVAAGVVGAMEAMGWGARSGDDHVGPGD